MVDNMPTGYCYQCPPDVDICPQCGGICMRPKDRINLDDLAPKRPSDIDNLVKEVDHAPQYMQLRKVNPWLADVLDQVMDMHLRKAQDYATADNPFVNFEDVAAAVGTDVDTVFRQFIAVKLARLKNLLTAGKTPNNESIDDTKLDLAVYALLYVAYAEKIRLDNAPDGMYSDKPIDETGDKRLSLE